MELLLNSTFWVAIAFVIFLALALRPGVKALTTMLDERAARIRSDLDEAQRLREEAQTLLATYQRRQRDALKDAEAILEHARDEADRLRRTAVTDLDAALARREAQAMDRIAQARQAAIQDVRNQAVDVAIAAAERILRDQLQGTKADRLIDDSIADLPNNLH